MPPSSLDPDGLRRLLRHQDGLIAVTQAPEVGLTGSALQRRLRAGHLRRVLPMVYAEGVADLTYRQRVRAALLFAGDAACLTGQAALVWRRLPHLPNEVTGDPIDVLVPASRHLRDTAWVRVTRTQRMPTPIRVDGVPTAPVTRAVVDAARWLSSYEAVLALVSSAVNGGRTTLAQVQTELTSSSARGSRLLREVLAEADAGVRSVAEARARRFFRHCGLPAPLVNEPIMVGDQTFVVDFLWGKVIVEIDSRAFHLLEEGLWERTQARRAALEAAGYRVLPYTPEQIRDTPDVVMAGILNALAWAAAS